MLLLITGSADGTSDLLISRLGNRAFRFNYDLYNQYAFQFRPDYWKIVSPSGHAISSDVVSSAFWWKAFNFPIEGEDRLIIEEVKYIFRELYQWCRLRGMAKGNAYDFHNRLGKMNVLDIASNFFEIPRTLATFRLAGLDGIRGLEIVAKSYSSALTEKNATLMTTAVDPKALHPHFPWYLQEKISSDSDETVFVCGQNIFAYRRDRSGLKGLDWRAEQNFDLNGKEWVKFSLSEAEAQSVKMFCAHIDVNWGRLDFMRRAGSLVFLEFNANGQWVFLDYSNNDGLLDCVVDYLAVA